MLTFWKHFWNVAKNDGTLLGGIGTASVCQGRRTDSAYGLCNINADQTWGEIHRSNFWSRSILEPGNISPLFDLAFEIIAFIINPIFNVTSSTASIFPTQLFKMRSSDFHLSWCPSLAIMFCHKARGECQERCEAPSLLWWVMLMCPQSYVDRPKCKVTNFTLMPNHHPHVP